MFTKKNEENPEVEKCLVKERRALGATKKMIGPKLVSRTAKIKVYLTVMVRRLTWRLNKNTEGKNRNMGKYDVR